MIRPNGIDLLNLIAERQGIINNTLNELVRCGFAGEKLKLEVDGPTPRCNHKGRNLSISLGSAGIV